MASQFSLLKDRRFAPLFIAQFLGAFNDNLFKALLVVMLAYGLIGGGGWRPEILVSLAAALFILPFATLAAPGGTLSDKFARDRMLRSLKLAEIVIVAGIIAGLIGFSLIFLLVVLFALGAQSALLSPAKYALLPQHLPGHDLIGANALMNTGSFVAILLGTIVGSLWGLDESGRRAAMVLMATCALIGYIASRFIPPAPAPAPDLEIGFNMLRDLRRNVAHTVAQPRSVRMALLGIAWFYFVGGTFLAQFPNFAKQTLGVDNIVLTVFMAVFTLGIAAGGLVNNYLLKAQISAKFVPAAALGIAVFTGDLCGAARAFESGGESLMTLSQFLGSYRSWHILFDIFMLSVCGGLYVVPLNTILQSRSAHALKARILSVSTILDALFILFSSLLAMALFALSFAVEDLFLVLAVATALLALYFGSRRAIFEEEEAPV